MEADADAGEAVAIGVRTAAAVTPAAASTRVTFIDLINNLALNSGDTSHVEKHEVINSRRA
ncbi:hypothetical protein ACWGLB_25125 [Streptomyces sp. NPDC055893]